MSEAFKCDRCKKYKEIGEINIISYRDYCGGWIDETAELCEKCNEEFIAFIKNKSYGKKTPKT